MGREAPRDKEETEIHGGVKGRVALEAPRERGSVQAIAARHELRPNQVSPWKRQMLDTAPEVFAKVHRGVARAAAGSVRPRVRTFSRPPQCTPGGRSTEVRRAVRQLRTRSPLAGSSRSPVGFLSRLPGDIFDVTEVPEGSQTRPEYILILPLNCPTK